MGTSSSRSISCSHMGPQLRIAAAHGRIRRVKYLVNRGAGANADNLNTALLCASQFGHMRIVKLLIRKGANNFEEANRFAIDNFHYKVSKLLVKRLKEQHVLLTQQQLAVFAER